MEDNREIKSVYSLVSPKQSLMDRRYMTLHQNFGRVGTLVQQYGIEVEIVDPPSRLVKRARKFNRKLRICYKYSAPRSRLQKLVERFHFSLTKYSKQPFFM